MNAKTRRKKHKDDLNVTSGERNYGEGDDEEPSQHLNKSKSKQQQQQDLSTTTASGILSLSNLIVPSTEEKPSIYIAQLLQQADLSELIQLDPINQIQYFLEERAHLMNQMDVFRTQYDKQYTVLKRRLDETETDNERLTAEHRSSTKELILYKNLVEAPQTSSSSKDYQEIKQTIEQVLEENQRLYTELNHFKTSDPVYDQVKLLELANRDLKRELNHLKNENNRLKKSLDQDETKNLRSKLTKTLEENEQLRLITKRTLQQQTSSPKQAHLTQSSRPSKSPDKDYPNNEVIELREQVHRLEKILHKRDHELEKLQNEIEKGTSSIMSSIEDLYLVSSNVSASALMQKSQPTIFELQNELDQLHDKLDDLLRENQFLKDRTREFDTIYEENEYLYAEKSQWNEEIERARIRQLLLEQEVRTLKEHEKESNLINDPSVRVNNSDTTQSKLKIDWLNNTNSRLELENVHLREQIDLLTKNYEQIKQDLIDKNQHYQQILEVAQDTQKLPQELARIEKLNNHMQTHFDNERREYERTIAELEEQSEKREQKYGSLYDTILKLQNDYRQRELEFVQQMNDVTKEREAYHTQLTSFQDVYEQLKQENKALREEISSKNEMNRDLKLAVTSSSNDTQTIYHQIRQLSTNLTNLQQKYDHDIAEQKSQLEFFRTEHKQIITNYDAELLRTHQTIIQLQHDNNQYSSELQRNQLHIEKLQTEINEKQIFIEQIQNDLIERSALHASIKDQLTQENKVKMTKIIELEQAIAQEHHRKTELHRTIQDLQNELIQSRSTAKDSLEKSEEFERRFRETDRHFTHLNETTEPTKRELNILRNELITKSDQNTTLQHTIEDEKLKRQRLEMKLKRLKEEYVGVRKELYNRLEENNSLQHEIVECRCKLEYYFQMNHQAIQSLKSSNDNQSSTAVQLYLKEKAENQHWQIKCQALQQKVEQLQKNYESIKEKYKRRLQEERDMNERTKAKYLEHIRNVQKDLHETRHLLEKDAELKFNQESAYQQLVEERRQLLTSMIDKDAKVREMRRENLLLSSKIELLENQMENLNERIDRTLRERSQLRRERLDSYVSIEASSRSSPSRTTTTTTYIDATGWTQPVYHTESFGFNNGHHETSAVS